MSGLPMIERHPDELLARVDGRPVTAGRFLALTRTFGGALPARRYIINLCVDRFWFAVAFGAGIRHGMTTLLPANRLAATVDELLADYPDSVVVSDGDGEQRWPGALDPRQVLPETTDDEPVPNIPPGLLAAIVFTSGSTGRSKPIHKPWLTLAESSRLNARALGARERRHDLLATVPPQHMWGLETSVLLPWFAPLTVSNAHPFFPGEILNRLAQLEAPRILVSTPVHLRSLAGLLEAEGVPADAVWSATAPLDPELAARLGGGRELPVTEVYGCSETGCLARRDPVADGPWEAFDAFTLSPGFPTRVRAAHLPGSVALQDRLEFQADGRFRLAGRNEDLVNIAGKRASLADLNQRLLRIPGVRDGVIFLPPPTGSERVQRLAALVVAPGLTAGQVRTALRTRIDDAFIPRPIRLVPALPRAETGKLARRAVLKLFERPAGAVHETA